MNGKRVSVLLLADWTVTTSSRNRFPKWRRCPFATQLEKEINSENTDGGDGEDETWFEEVEKIVDQFLKIYQIKVKGKM